MRGIAAAASVAVVVGVIGAVVMLQPASVKAQSAGTIVGATVCNSSSSVALAAPVNDSVVADPTVPLSGTVSQSSQIDVYIDDVFDHVIPLAIGQTNFIDSIQLSAGTHTVKVVAISTCPGGDGSAASVITYTPPPVAPSTGGTTPTEVDNEREGKESVSTDEKVAPAPSGESFPELMTIGFNEVLEWLNINVADSSEGQKLSLWRAVVMGAGTYLVVIGMAVSVVKVVAGLPMLAASLPDAPMTKRHRWVSWGFRILGLLLVLGALFL